MNKVLDSAKMLSGVSIIPESAPFNTEQRAWLNGFFAGMTGMEEIRGDGQSGAGDVSVAEVEEEEDFPWHDESIELEERLEMAEGRPFNRQLMAAMAQLDCGSCGYLCESYSDAIATGAETNLTLCSPGGKETARAVKKLVKLNAAQGDTAEAGNSGSNAPSNSATAVEASAGWTRKNPFPAKLICSTKLTGEASAKDVRHVEIDLTGSDLKYDVGDALGVYPTNCPDLIQEIVKACGESVEDGASFLLTKDLSAATDELAQWYIDHLSDTHERKKAEAIAHSDDTIDDMDVLDFITSFKTMAIPLTDLLECIDELNPRLYSIASSLKKHADQVHLTVGKVNYEKHGRVRKGVASTMLAERIASGERLNVFVQPSHGFTVPTNVELPIIMVGPGTGIAPFVSFLQEREATNAPGDNWLFFGDQKSESDFLYRDMIQDYLQRGVLKRLDTAFSRDQQHKIYVQDRMREQGAEIFRWLEAGGHFYVCGDASRMAKDVDKALHEIVAEHGEMPPEQAVSYVKQLVKDARYQRDVY